MNNSGYNWGQHSWGRCAFVCAYTVSSPAEIKFQINNELFSKNVSSIAWASCILSGNRGSHPILTDHQNQVLETGPHPECCCSERGPQTSSTGVTEAPGVTLSWWNAQSHQPPPQPGASARSSYYSNEHSHVRNACPWARVLSQSGMVGKSIRNNYHTRTRWFSEKMRWRWNRK